MVRKTRRRQKQLGGTYVSKGTYGCTFRRPALRCAGEDERRPDKFTKLLSEKSANDELHARHLLEPLDPERNYFIYPEDVCRPAPLEPSDELDKCPYDFSDLTKARVLIEEDGGEILPEVSLRANDYIPFFRSLKRIMDGLIVIHARGIAHNDIKPENIVSKRLSDGKFLTRFIDFGFLVDANTLEADAANPDHQFDRFCIFWIKLYVLVF